MRGEHNELCSVTARTLGILECDPEVWSTAVSSSEAEMPSKMRWKTSSNKGASDLKGACIKVPVDCQLYDSLSSGSWNLLVALK